MPVEKVRGPWYNSRKLWSKHCARSWQGNEGTWTGPGAGSAARVGRCGGARPCAVAPTWCSRIPAALAAHRAGSLLRRRAVPPATLSRLPARLTKGSCSAAASPPMPHCGRAGSAGAGRRCGNYRRRCDVSLGCRSALRRHRLPRARPLSGRQGLSLLPVCVPAPVAACVHVFLLLLVSTGRENSHFRAMLPGDKLPADQVQGIRINDFSIGFGPRVFGFEDKDGVTYSFRLFPLGGFVSFPEGVEEEVEAGEEDGAARSAAAGRTEGPEGERPNDEKTYDIDDPDLIQNRPAVQRAAVISAGVLFNLIRCSLYLYSHSSLLAWPYQSICTRHRHTHTHTHTRTHTHTHTRTRLRTRTHTHIHLNTR